MCGIYGLQLRPGQELSAYQRAVLVMTLAEEMESRGRESFGAALWTPDHAGNTPPVVLKGLGRVTEKGYSVLSSLADSAGFFAHTRQPTGRSAVTVENAHPFWIGKVIGVHNGIVNNDDDLAKKYGRDFGVDSMHIFAHLNEGLPTKELSVWGTVLWVHEDDGFAKVYFARSGSGQWEVARLYREEKHKDDGQPSIGTISASTTFAIRKAVERAGLYAQCLEIKSEHLYYLADGEAYDGFERFDFGYLSSPSYNTGNGGCARNRVGYAGTHGPYGDSNSGNSWRGRPDFDQWPGVTTSDDNEPVDASDDGPVFVLAEPLPANVLSGKSFNKVYFGTGTAAEMSLLCPDCNCRLNKHVWGFCLESRCTTKRKGNQCHVPRVPLCESCGCHLIETVHEVVTVAASEVTDRTTHWSEFTDRTSVHCCACKEDCAVVPSDGIVAPDKGQNSRLTKKQRRNLTQGLVKAVWLKDESLVCCGEGCTNMLTGPAKALGMCWKCRHPQESPNLPRCSEPDCDHPLFSNDSVKLGVCESCRHRKTTMRDQVQQAVEESADDQTTRNPYDAYPRRCSSGQCGNRLVLEQERDSGVCATCAYRQHKAANTVAAEVLEGEVVGGVDESKVTELTVSGSDSAALHAFFAKAATATNDA